MNGSGWIWAVINEPALGDLSKMHCAERWGKIRRQGFSLVELLVVIVIIGIMAVVAVQSFTSPSRKLKNSMFMIRNDLNLARSEAVNRSTDVLVEFVFNIGADQQDGYKICVDDNASNTCDGSGGGDTPIKDMLFPKEIQFYDTTGGAIAGGPLATSGGSSSLVNKSGVVLSWGNPYFSMKQNGTSTHSGSIVVYVPNDATPPTAMLVSPMCVVVTNTTGRVRIEYWNKTTSTWDTK